MLETLRIQNYALIDDLEIDFGSGFNALTGETGAGKSIVLGALNLVLGGRASSDILRDPAKPAKIDAVFNLVKSSKRLRAILHEHEIAPQDHELLISRSLSAEGRSRGYVCGNLVPISVLAEIGDELVDLHGQHEHQSLLRPERQLDLLDAFADVESIAEDITTKTAALRDLTKEMIALESDDRERARRLDYLRHEVNEINGAGLRAGEEEELKARRNLIANAERIFTLASQARSALYEGEDGSAILSIDSANADVTELAQIDERFRSLLPRLTEARAIIEEISIELRSYADRVEFDPNELDELNERLTSLSALKRKYGRSIEEIIEYRDRAVAELATYDSRDQILVELRARHKYLLADARATASTLSQKRKAAARKLDKLVTESLQELGMKGGCLQTSFEETELNSTGTDRIEFTLAANPGEKLKPLRLVASGGEISRIMLAMKAVFASGDKIPTLVFDEIDAGVGGGVARNVARKLRALAESHQTICITHLAQIAATATRHYNVAKSERKGRNITNVVEMNQEARVSEIARLLDGSVSDVSVKHARALLKEMSEAGA
jgi:DNA repair protein RecN (Recombination protein N)